MKKQLLALLISSTSFLSLAGCSDGTPVVSDNSNSFERAETYYQRIKNNTYDYYDYEDVSENERTTWEFYIFTRTPSVNGMGTGSEEMFHEEYEKFSIEFPLKIDESKKYVLSNFDAIDIIVQPTYDDTLYASSTFTNAFDEFLSDEKFNGKTIAVDEVKNTFGYNYSANTKDTTYYLFNDGYVGREYSNGIHLSSKIFPFKYMFQEYLSIRTYRNSGLEITLKMGIDDFTTFTVSYNNKSIELKNFKEYMKSYDKASPYSIVINTKKFDFSKMIDVSYKSGEKTIHYYLSKDGLIISAFSSTVVLGYEKVFYLARADENNVGYNVVHSKYLDTEALFALFE